VRVELHPKADEEFAAQVQYYDEQQSGLGRRFYREVIANLEWISENPELPRLRKSYRRVNLKLFPFYIAYVVERDLVWVAAIAHGKRKPNYWIRRLRGVD
jgi:hypothetical protein